MYCAPTIIGPGRGKSVKEPCPEIEMLAAYAEGGLADDERLKVETHIVSCSACRKTVVSTFRALFTNEQAPELKTPKLSRT
jgi:anti-sigma factor ChrR (cupin superfamily)